MTSGNGRKIGEISLKGERELRWEWFVENSFESGVEERRSDAWWKWWWWWWWTDVSKMRWQWQVVFTVPQIMPIYPFSLLHPATPPHFYFLPTPLSFISFPFILPSKFTPFLSCPVSAFSRFNLFPLKFSFKSISGVV